MNASLHIKLIEFFKDINISSFKSDVTETGKSSPKISNGKSENGIRSPDSTKLTLSVNGGQDGSSDRGGSASPIGRLNGDRNRDSPLTTCDDGNEDMSTPTPSAVPLHQQMSSINLQDDQHQQPTATIHGVQVNSNSGNCDDLLTMLRTVSAAEWDHLGKLITIADI